MTEDTTTCRECEAPIPATAKRCRHCSAVQKPTNPLVAVLCVGFIIFVGFNLLRTLT